LVYDNTGSGTTTTGVENVKVEVVAPTATPFNKGLFFLKTIGSDVYLNYAANPALSVNSGADQSAFKSMAVPTAPTVLLKDDTTVLGGVRVSFAVTGGGGAVANAVAVTNASGIASVGTWTLGAEAGPNTLSAAVAGSGTTLSVSISATGLDGPYVFEIPGVAKLTVTEYVVQTQSNGAFAVARNADLELTQFSGLSPVTLSEVSLFATNSVITGFEVLGLTVTSSGYIGSSSYKLLEFTSLSVTISQLKATQASTWSLDTASVSLSATSVTLLPNEADLTASVSNFSASVDITTGAFAAAGSARVNVKGALLASGTVAVTKSTQTNVSLGGLSGSTPIELLTVELTSAHLFVGAGGGFDRVVRC